MTQDNPSYFERMKLIKLGLLPKEAVAKAKKPIAKMSVKKMDEQKAAKEAGTDNGMDKFFERNRKKMVGVCQCGCTRKSSKFEDDHYRSSIAHIFPKRIFKSIATNDLNWVERNFWDGCHSNFDNRSIERWVNYADWDDIKERFHALVPLLTEEERKTKFYKKLELIIYAGC